MDNNDRRVPRRYPPDDEPGNVFAGIASGLILMCMLAGLIIALVMVWRVVGG